MDCSVRFTLSNRRGFLQHARFIPLFDKQESIIVHAFRNPIISINVARREVSMSKKTIMLGLFGIGLILFLLCAAVQFAVYPTYMIYQNKEELKAKWSILNTDDVIDTLYTISEEISADLAVMLPSDDGQYDFYRTEWDPAFIRLESLAPDRVYATDPRDGQEKLRGFFFITNDHFRIAPLRTLKGSETELFITTILVESRDMSALRNALERHGAEVGAEGVTSIEIPKMQFVVLPAAFFLFLIAAVFYAFSRAKDMIVKKTLGYGDRDVVLAELKQLCSSLLLISGTLLLLSAILFSLLAGVSSTLLFFRKSALPFLLYFAVTLLVISVCIEIISARCSVSSSKGKSLDRQLYVCTVVFKAVVIWALAACLTSIFSDVGELRDLIRRTEQAAELADGYAWTKPYNLSSDESYENPGVYAPRMYAFYQEMHDTHNLIVAEFHSIRDDSPVEAPGNNLLYYEASINDNYLDTFDTVYGIDGAPIHSDQIEKGKRNLLVPQDFDIDRFFEAWHGLHREDFHFVLYDAAKSKFFAFTNKLEGGYAYSGEIPIVVFIEDPELYLDEEDVMARMGVVKTMIGNSVFLYDSTSELSPYEQILPLLRENGLDRTFGPASAVKQEFLSSIKDCQNRITLQTIAALMILFAFAVLAFDAAALYYKVYTKDIAVKLISGYSFLDLFSLRMALKLGLLPILILMPKVSTLAALFCVAADLGVFVLCIKRNIRRNVAAVMKGA